MHLVSSYIQPWEKSFLGMSQFDGFFSSFFVFMHDRNSPSFIYSWFVELNSWPYLHKNRHHSFRNKVFLKLKLSKNVAIKIIKNQINFDLLYIKLGWNRYLITYFMCCTKDLQESWRFNMPKQINFILYLRKV